MVGKFPVKLLDKIFKVIGEDYETLYSCILVSKTWSKVFIPTLWKHPFYCNRSIEILINCLLVEDDDFLTKKNISLPFPLLEQPPLFNYAKFATTLNLSMSEYLNKLMYLKYKDENLRDRLIKFIISHSSIEYLNTSFLKGKLLTEHPDFRVCFKNLKEFETTDTYSPNFFITLSKTCDNIQAFKLSFSIDKDISGIEQLIKSQKQVKKIHLNFKPNVNLSLGHLKNAISSHSRSIVEYRSTGSSQVDLEILILELKNLKTLHLESSELDVVDVLDTIKSTSFSNLRELSVKFFDVELLDNMSTFIGINGYNLKSLEIGGNPSDRDGLSTLLDSISYCRNLEDLTVFYANNLHSYLIDIFRGCRRLKKIYLRLICGIVIFVDDIVTALTETRPKHLESIKFGNNINVTDIALMILCKKWSGPKPFLLSYSNYKQHSIKVESPIPVLNRCSIMGFLEYEITDEKPESNKLVQYSCSFLLQISYVIWWMIGNLDVVCDVDKLKGT